MPGPHFNSKRLKAAQNVRAEFAPGSVPRVGTRLFTLRLLPRTVESNCGCRIPLPPPVDPIKYVTVNIASLANNDQVMDGGDFWGTNANPPFSFIHTYGVQIGDEITITHPTNNTPIVVTVQNILNDAGTGRAYRIITNPAHGIAALTNNVTVKIIDRS